MSKFYQKIVIYASREEELGQPDGLIEQVLDEELNREYLSDYFIAETKDLDKQEYIKALESTGVKVINQ